MDDILVNEYLAIAKDKDLQEVYGMTEDSNSGNNGNYDEKIAYSQKIKTENSKAFDEMFS